SLRRDPERARRPRQPVARLPELAERADASDRLDAADAGADRLLLGDEEQADVAGAVAVRAAAELAAVPGLDDPDLVVVLLAEERHRAGGERLLQRHGPRMHVRVREDLTIHLVLDAPDLFRREAAAECEVEAQIGRVDQ